MNSDPDVVVIGGGIGGLCAAILLAGNGKRVRVLEASASWGGKAGTIELDGVEVDTGPSVLTLPDVFDEVFASANMTREKELVLTKPEPAFRYLYPDGACVDVHHDVADTLDSVAASLGSSARSELEKYLAYSKKIWDAAAPHFVMSEAPNVGRLLLGGFGAWGAVTRIDPLRSLQAAIESYVKSPHLRKLLMRYATYNGSDARRAPATLGCIAHVELALGGYGVEGGMSQLVVALLRAATKLDIDLRLESKVSKILVEEGAVRGVITDGETHHCAQIICNADVAHLAKELLDNAPAALTKTEPSMSAYNAIFRARRRGGTAARVAHTVLFPDDYESEFADIFDRQRTPETPTIYLCAQEACHHRQGWPEHEPVFAMVNAPAIGAEFSGDGGAKVQEKMATCLSSHGLIDKEDQCCFLRTPQDLARAFPGSNGSLYGAASNDRSAAFARPPNRMKTPNGLYLASGSAHPGGGVPMVAQSGKQAARAALNDIPTP